MRRHHAIDRLHLAIIRLQTVRRELGRSRTERSSFHQTPTIGWLFSGLILLLAPLGCSIWKDSSGEPLDLPAARMSNDSVAMEMTFVRVPGGAPEINEKLWEEIDEQLIPVDTRLHLNNNGFRCGLVGMQLPASLRQLLDRQQAETKLDQAVTSDLDVLSQNQRVQRRSGQRWEIVTGAPRDQLVVLHKDAVNQKVSGKPLKDAQCILGARLFPQGDASIKLEITPEVHHGAPRKQWVAGEGTFQLLSGREREIFHDLTVQVGLHPGQTLVLSCTPDMKGLGHSFFVEQGRGDTQQKLLLIRLAQSQRDELFEDPKAPHAP